MPPTLITKSDVKDKMKELQELKLFERWIGDTIQFVRLSYEIANKKYIVVLYDGMGGTLTTRCSSVQEAVDKFNKYVVNEGA